jgi:uncharacterized protein
MNETTERKSAGVLTARSAENGEVKEKIIEGYFSVFNTPTELWGGVYEQVAPTAFKNSINNNLDIKAYFNHNSDVVLGRTNANTLSLRTDNTGLYGTIIINENDAQALNVYERVKRGDITQCSFGFRNAIETQTSYKDGKMYTIDDLKLIEVSICTNPQYEETEIVARRKVIKEIKTDIENRKKEMLKKMRRLQNETI